MKPELFALRINLSYGKFIIEYFHNNILDQLDEHHHAYIVMHSPELL
jgi:hypothetical protein